MNAYFPSLPSLPPYTRNGPRALKCTAVSCLSTSGIQYRGILWYPTLSRLYCLGNRLKSSTIWCTLLKEGPLHSIIPGGRHESSKYYPDFRNSITESSSTFRSHLSAAPFCMSGKVLHTVFRIYPHRFYCIMFTYTHHRLPFPTLFRSFNQDFIPSRNMNGPYCTTRSHIYRIY